ncbi:MAG: tRNA (N(6)-L-threonylcarbamoyladenosine(37)-C(2))-methylthiotransferase MtaB [Clostridiales bacterium]|nr:tRNA (N(6)-L-threonylcarbamoyladenosine(37)-C(2))-methylthiotransferase MtaB [Clostridiales bacterium]
MKIVVFTLGCKVNQCESDSLIRGLSDMGHEVFDELAPADLYVVNTCAVTSEAEKKSRQMVSRIKKFNKEAKIIFTGCATQKDYKGFLNKGVSYITGSFNKNQILEIVKDIEENDKKDQLSIKEEDKVFEDLLSVKSLRARTYVKVQDGCNNFCSYCIIPYLRGRSRSRSIDSIKKEIAETNPKEVVLNGINLSAYNFNGTNLTGLLKELKDVKARIRLGSLEVNVIDDEFLNATKELYDFAPHFHLSLQSGSNNVLKLMNRHYTREEYIKKVELIRSYYENAGITTDIIAGFSGETEQDFLDTVELVKTVKFSDIHAFPYSRRAGTKAYTWEEVDGETKKKRLNKLLELKNEYKSKFINENIGKVLRFLPEEEKEGCLLGYTENYIRVYLKDGKLTNDILKVRILSEYEDGALAKLI